MIALTNVWQMVVLYSHGCISNTVGGIVGSLKMWLMGGSAAGGGWATKSLGRLLGAALLAWEAECKPRGFLGGGYECLHQGTGNFSWPVAKGRATVVMFSMIPTTRLRGTRAQCGGASKYWWTTKGKGSALGWWEPQGSIAMPCALSGYERCNKNFMVYIMWPNWLLTKERKR